MQGTVHIRFWVVWDVDGTICNADAFSFASVILTFGQVSSGFCRGRTCLRTLCLRGRL